MNEIATLIFLFQTLDQMMTGTVKVTSDAVLAVVLYTKGIQEKALKSLFSRQLIIAHTCISGKYYQKILKNTYKALLSNFIVDMRRQNIHSTVHQTYRYPLKALKNPKISNITTTMQSCTSASLC